MQSHLIHTALFGDTGPAGETLQKIYGSGRIDYLAHKTRLYPRIVTSANLPECLPELHNLEVIFSTWGMFPLTGEHLDALPNLRAVFYAGGTVKYFAIPLLERGITVVSGWAANAVPVAEFTLGQILLANKGYFRNVREYLSTQDYAGAHRGQGNYKAVVSILGAGQIGRRLIELLRPFHLRVLVFDPFLTYKAAEVLGVEKVELDEAFQNGDIVSNHLADVPATRGMLHGEHFRAMKMNATFINTGRGRTVNHDDLAEVFRTRPDLTALLDVTYPEPLPSTSPLRALPNIQITSHIAGSINQESGRVADYILEEFEAWRVGQPLRYAVTMDMLDSMA
jgi:phosphoglycerate dehydrogenase-like enzyme